MLLQHRRKVKVVAMESAALEVAFDDDDTADSRKKKKRALSRAAAAWWLAVFAIATFCFVLAGELATSSVSLPRPRHAADTPVTAFSEERARELLEFIDALGDRQFSTPAVSTAFDRIEAGLHNISAAARAAGSAVRLEWVRGMFDNTGAYGGLSMLTLHGPIIAVRLSDGSDGVRANAVLLDAHVDSFVFAKGVSDNGVSVANALEVVRCFAMRERWPWMNAVIVVFDTEEISLQGARAFMQRHPWRESVRAFVNLDDGGTAMSGEYLLQASSKWAADHYARAVPHPLAYSLFNDLFTSGLISSGTHYQVYRAFGLEGIDLNYPLNGWYYHTELDDISRVAQGALQHEGENILALLDSMASDPELASLRFRNMHATPGGFVSSYGSTSYVTPGGQAALFVVFFLVLLADGVLICHNSSRFADWQRCLAAMLAAFGFALASLLAGIVLAVVAAAIACANNQAVFNAHYKLFGATGVIAGCVGALLPHLLFPAAISRIMKRLPSPDVLPWISSVGVLLLEALLFVLVSALGWGYALTVLLDFVFVATAALVALAANAVFSKRSSRFKFFAGFCLPLGVAVVPLLAWGAPTFGSVLPAFLPTLARSPMPSPGVIGTAVWTLVALVSLLPLLLIFQYGGTFTSAKNEKSPGASFAWLAVAAWSAILVILVIALLALPPFTAQYPTRITATHHANVSSAGSSQILITFTNNNKMTALEKHLREQGHAAEPCSDAITLYWQRSAGLCISATAQPPVSVPGVNVSCRVIPEDASRLNVTASFWVANTTSTLLLFLPPEWSVSELVLDGLSNQPANGTKPIVVSFGYGCDLNRPLVFSFVASAAEAAGSSFRVTAEALARSEQFDSVISSLPSWAVPWGGAITPVPSSISFDVDVPPIA